MTAARGEAAPAARADAEAAPTAGALPTAGELPPPGSPVHLVGIGGAGMRGLAVLLAEAGYRVSGCDRGDVAALDELRARDVELLRGHAADHVAGSRLVVHTSAVPSDAPELAAAREAGTPVLKRARALGALLAGRRVVGVAGTHGKTTITAMTGRVLEAAGLDPAVVVGGEVAAWDGYARPGAGELAVVEADEFDRSFLELDPSLAVVSSMEAEHLDTYGGVDAVEAAFETFARRALERDGVLACADDPGARRLAAGLGAGAATYGLGEGADYRAEALEEAPDRRRCRLAGPEGAVEFDLRVPGRHNLENAAAALAVALRLGADADAAAAAMGAWRGVARRLETLASAGGVVVVDDYAHHPTEVRASLGALRSRHPAARLVAVFQPHLFSRTRDFAAAFGRELTAADLALVLPIYPSREEPIPGVTPALITRDAPATVRTASDEEALQAVRAAVDRRATEPRAVFVFMGAGDVTALAGRAAALVEDPEPDALGA